MNRRNFIKSSIFAAALPTILPSSVFGQSAPSKRINAVFIGCGDRASQILGGAMANTNCKVIGGCDPKSDALDRTINRINNHYGNKDAKKYKDYREVLADPNVDAVFIITPDHNHTPIAIAAARAGKHIYCEKGLSIAMNWRKELRKALIESKVTFQYGTQQRSEYYTGRAVELVRNGYIGNLQEVVLNSPCLPGNIFPPALQPMPDGFDYDQWLGVAPMIDFHQFRVHQQGSFHIYDYALGYLAGWGAHPLDLAQFGMDADNTGPIKVEGTGLLPTAGIFDTVYDWDILFTYENKVKCKFSTPRHVKNHLQGYTFNMERYPQVVFIGDEGYIGVDRGMISYSNPKLDKVILRPSDWRVSRLSRRLYDHTANFLNCIKSGETPISNFEAAIRSDTLSHLSDAVVRSGKSMDWNPKTEMAALDIQNRIMCRNMRKEWAV